VAAPSISTVKDVLSGTSLKGGEAIAMQRIRTRSELLGQIARLKAENKRLQGTLDEIADIVNDEPQDETNQDHGPEDDEEEEDDR